MHFHVKLLLRFTFMQSVLRPIIKIWYLTIRVLYVLYIVYLVETECKIPLLSDRNSLHKLNVYNKLIKRAAFVCTLHYTVVLVVFFYDFTFPPFYSYFARIYYLPEYCLLCGALYPAIFENVSSNRKRTWFKLNSKV